MGFNKMHYVLLDSRLRGNDEVGSFSCSWRSRNSGALSSIMESSIMVYEFEALLFVQPSKFADWVDSYKAVIALGDQAQKYATPEDINDGPESAPSKRILAAMPSYQKTFHGPLIACEIGLDAMRAACPHFHGWLQKLEALPPFVTTT